MPSLVFVTAEAIGPSCTWLLLALSLTGLEKEVSISAKTGCYLMKIYVIFDKKIQSAARTKYM